MSEPENKTPPEDKNERESILRILDELVSHMNTSRNVSMLLIISAFVLTPMSLVMAVLLLSAPTFVPGHEVRFVGGNFGNGSPVGIEGGSNASKMHQGMYNQQGSNTSRGGAMPMQEVAPNQMFPSPGPPRFMIEGGPHMRQILDISTVIIIFIVISIVLSAVLLFIGIKEFSFFSKWNKKFSRFTSLKDKVDKELGD